MKKQYDPIDRDIIRVLAPLRRGITPARVADTIGIHPATAKRRIEKLWKDNKVLDCKPKGNRLICKINKGMIRKEKFFKDY